MVPVEVFSLVVVKLNLKRKSGVSLPNLCFWVEKEAILITNIGGNMVNFDVEPHDLLMSSCDLEVEIHHKLPSRHGPWTMGNDLPCITLKIKVGQKCVFHHLLPIKLTTGASKKMCSTVVLLKCRSNSLRAALQGFCDVLSHFISCSLC